MVEHFRSLTSILDYFVPTYGIPGNSFIKDMVVELMDLLSNEFSQHTRPQQTLHDFLTGKTNALSDYRVLIAADGESKLPYLHTFSESNFGEPVEQFEFDGRKFTRSSLNYLLGLSMLKKYLNDDVPKTILEVGGGFGALGEILANSGIQDLRYIDVDIPPTSFVAQSYLANVLGKENVATYEQIWEMKSIDIDTLPQVSVFCSWQIEKLQGQVDLFVNFISFQEMEPFIVKNYLDHVNRLNARWILLRNMREGKQVKKDKHSVGVKIPILSDDYRALLPGYELVARNVIPFGYRTVDNYHSELLLLKRNK